MDVGTAQDALASCGLPEAWRDKAAWTVLDTHFGDGTHFLACWQAWQADPQRPRMLHYVGLMDPQDAAALAGELTRSTRPLSPQLRVLAQTLANHCHGLDAGFHRLLLDGGLLSLTLCVGDTKTLLAAQMGRANTAWVHDETPAWDKWTSKALARCCQRGARLHARLASTYAQAWWKEAGFVDLQVQDGRATGRFNPPWVSAHHDQTPAPRTPTRCAIIGAGLSGASVAHALALRGWAVTVLDAQAQPAAGASGLPTGLVVPHVSADDSPRSRMSRVGTHLMLQHAERMLVPHQDWAHTGVMEHRLATGTTLWHAQAAWIKPAQLIAGWLRHPGIRFVGNAPVASLHWADDAWTLRDGAGHVVACAEVLVIANATGCLPLLLPASSNPSTTKLPLAGSVVEKLQILQAVHGTISRGPLPQNTAAEVDWPVHPVNGHGSFIPAVPGPQGLEWLAGATFEPDTIGARSEHTIAPLAEQHRANLHRLEALLPAVGQALAPAFQAQTVSHWSGTRCVTHDRLPLVGPLLEQAQPSLWIQAGQGARGLSFSALGAELLVAQLGQEPWPLDATLARSLDVRRVRRRKAVSAQDGD